MGATLRRGRRSLFGRRRRAELRSGRKNGPNFGRRTASGRQTLCVAGGGFGNRFGLQLGSSLGPSLGSSVAICRLRSSELASWALPEGPSNRPQMGPLSLPLPLAASRRQVEVK